MTDDTPRHAAPGRRTPAIITAVIAVVTALTVTLHRPTPPGPTWDGQLMIAIGWDSLQNEVLVDGDERRPHFAGASFVMREGFAAEEIGARAEGYGNPENALGQYSYEAYDTLVVLALAALRAGTDSPQAVTQAVAGVFEPADGPTCGPRGDLPLARCVERALTGGPVGYSGFSSALRQGRGGTLNHTPLMTGRFEPDGSLTIRDRPIPTPTPTFCPVSTTEGRGAGDGTLRIASANVADALRSDPTVTSSQAAAHLDLLDAGFPWPLDIVGYDLGVGGTPLGTRASADAIDILTVATVHWIADEDVETLAGTGVLLSLPLISGYRGPLCAERSTTLPWHDEVNLAVETLRLAAERGGTRVHMVLGNESVSQAWRRSIHEHAAAFGLTIVGDTTLTNERYTSGRTVADDIAEVLATSPDVIVLGGTHVPEFVTWGEELQQARR